VNRQQADKSRVLYLLAWGRSGTTLLGSILGQLPTFFDAGEMYYIWQRSFVEDQLCSNGVAFSQSDTWRNIVEAAYGHVDSEDIERMETFLNVTARTRSVFFHTQFGRQHLRKQIQEHGDYLGKLYRAIREVTGCHVIIDSSKFPFYAYVLDQIPSIDLYVIHMIRDARATAYSWQKKKYNPSIGDYMPRLNPVRNSVYWNLWNLVAERLFRKHRERYLFLRYEDFVASTKKHVERILSFVDENASDLPFSTDREVALKPTQSISGNPNRFVEGTVAIRQDDAWKTHLSPRSKFIVNAITWPLLIKYGYVTRSLPDDGRA